MRRLKGVCSGLGEEGEAGKVLREGRMLEDNCVSRNVGGAHVGVRWSDVDLRR